MYKRQILLCSAVVFAQHGGGGGGSHGSSSGGSSFASSAGFSHGTSTVSSHSVGTCLLYTSTQSGGTAGGSYGTVFQLTPTGTLTTLHSFSGSDGAAPYGSLLLAANGDFYGTTNVGAAYGAGSVFTITSAGVLTTLYNFCSQSGCSDGQYPVCLLYTSQLLPPKL